MDYLTLHPPRLYALPFFRSLLRLYTLNAAYAMGRESEVGSLETGKRADMVVLSHDVTAVEPEFIREIAVEQTYVDGKLAHSR